MNPAKALPLILLTLTMTVLAPLTPAAAQSAPVRKEFIPDPALNNMHAFEVTIPAKWHFQGTLIQGTSCSGVPFPVFRTASPDGLNVLERLPRLDWVWGNGPQLALQQGNCLPLKAAMSAKDFLKYLIATMNLEYAGDDPVPQATIDAANKGMEQAKAAFAAKYAAAGMTPPTETLQFARAFVRYKNGTFPMKGVMAANVHCTQMTIHAMPGAPTWVTNTCSANVRYIHAPEAQLQAAAAMLDANGSGAAEVSDWVQAWMQNNQRQTDANMAQIRKNGEAATAQTRASAEQFQHSQDVRQHMHEQFLATMQRGTNMSMNRAAEASNARHTAASDWVDLSLDQQTVRDPNSGQITKVSSANTYTWLDNSGKVSYQTNDPNANPNGTLNGNWTRQQVIHGDGTN